MDSSVYVIMSLIIKVLENLTFNVLTQCPFEVGSTTPILQMGK